MSEYQVNFTGLNSLYIDVWEPDGVDAGKTFTLIGNKSTGEAFYMLLKIPDGLPAGATVSSATIRMPEMAYPSYRGAASLTAKFSRIVGAWSASTTWSTCPGYDSAVYSTHTFNEDAPSSTNYDYRTGYHAAYYKHKYVKTSDGSFLYMDTSVSTPPSAPTGYAYVSTQYYSAYYDTYIKYRTVDITQQIQDTIDSGGTGLIVWFDLPGPNDSRKYFKTPVNSDTNLQFLLTVDYTTDPSPSNPTIDSIATITAASKAFNWSDSTDSSGHFTSAELTYEMQIAPDGTTWGATQTSTTSDKTIDLKTYFSLAAAQYYYNTLCKIRVRAKTPLYGGSYYYSDWVVSSAFTIDYRITPTAPTLSVDNATPYEGQSVTFTCGRPTSYNTLTAAGATNALTYYVRLASGTALANGNAAVTSATKTIAYTVGNLTAGDDLVTTINAYCVDTETQTGAACAGVAFTVKRFRKPIVSIGEIFRTETGATVPFTIQDTGYGGVQSNAQITKVQYDIGAGYVDATLGAWSGLNNSFPITGLTAGTQYTISVRAVNDAPAGLSDITGDAATGVVLAFLPEIYAFKDSELGVSGIIVKALAIEQDDFNKNDFMLSLDGWTRTYDTWAYSSVDDPIGIMTVPSGAASKYTAGDRIKFTNGGNVIKGIIVVVADTSIKFLHEIDPADGLALNLIAGSAITETYYSHSKAPLGFPLDPLKWTAYLRYATLTTIATPTADVWYNPDSKYIDVPIGCWNLKYTMCVDAGRASSTDLTMYASLSTANNSESDIDFTAFNVAGGATGTIRTSMVASKEKAITVASKTRYYPIVKVGRTGISNIYVQSGICPMSIRAACAYL